MNGLNLPLFENAYFLSELCQACFDVYGGNLLFSNSYYIFNALLHNTNVMNLVA